MKNKSKNQPLKKKKEFRFRNVLVDIGENRFKNIRHPAYIFYEKGNIFIYVQLTHSRNVGEYILFKLRTNPKPKDQHDSFWIAEIKEATKDQFGRREDKWKIDPLDDEDIRKFFNKKR